MKNNIDKKPKSALKIGIKQKRDEIMINHDIKELEKFVKE